MRYDAPGNVLTDCLGARYTYSPAWAGWQEDTAGYDVLTPDPADGWPFAPNHQNPNHGPHRAGVIQNPAGETIGERDAPNAPDHLETARRFVRRRGPGGGWYEREIPDGDGWAPRESCGLDGEQFDSLEDVLGTIGAEWDDWAQLWQEEPPPAERVVRFLPDGTRAGVVCELRPSAEWEAVELPEG